LIVVQAAAQKQTTPHGRGRGRPIGRPTLGSRGHLAIARRRGRSTSRSLLAGSAVSWGVQWAHGMLHGPAQWLRICPRDHQLHSSTLAPLSASPRPASECSMPKTGKVRMVLASWKHDLPPISSRARTPPHAQASSPTAWIS